MTIQIDVFYRSSNGDRWELMRDMRPAGNQCGVWRRRHRTACSVLDRPGTSSENMRSRALLEEAGRQDSSLQLRSEWRTLETRATTVLIADLNFKLKSKT